LYLVLYETIRVLILENEIPAGLLLPSTRKLAASLLLSRSTVNRAYELLQMEGYVESRQGAGHRVTGREESSHKSLRRADTRLYPELSLSGRSFLENIGHINPTDDKEIAFRPGLPPLDIFPVKQWQRLHNFYWKHSTYSDLSYYPTSGIEPLKKSLANYLNVSRGIRCDFQQIIVVSGSLQSMFLVGKTLIEPGDGMIMEDPTFPNVYTLFKSLNASIHPVEPDKEGMAIGTFRDPENHTIKLIHVTPSSHYPNGVKMSMKRRREVLDFAKKHRALIIENDYEHEVSREKNDIPTLFSLDTEDRVVYLGTFNRLLHPAIRIGFMVVPYYLLDAVQSMQKLSHRFISPSVQYVMNQFIERKYLHNHLVNLVEIARERKSRFRRLFGEAFGEHLKLAGSDTEILHLVARLPENIPESRYIRLLQENNIVVHSLSKCYIGEPRTQGLIIGYSCVPYPVMRQKILKMASLYRSAYLKNWYD
jgi:GntR family transcriptional regulator/MocR family aminotransferase